MNTDFFAPWTGGAGVGVAVPTAWAATRVWGTERRPIARAPPRTLVTMIRFIVFSLFFCGLGPNGERAAQLARERTALRSRCVVELEFSLEREVALSALGLAGAPGDLRNAIDGDRDGTALAAAAALGLGRSDGKLDGSRRALDLPFACERYALSAS